jgi:hypothetical protein
MRLETCGYGNILTRAAVRRWRDAVGAGSSILLDIMMPELDGGVLGAAAMSHCATYRW